MVKAWRESVVIPTYEIGEAEKNPIFLEKRVYQGSSGVVYPYPVVEKIADKPVDHEWKAVWLENEYIKVMILPELGGRVQMAYDKIRQRHFVYYNSVIKPALVGLTGPWISGGIEFNWPQHHRPSTYLPVDSTIQENEDGSVTVWVSETERMFHQKGMAGFTLRPGCAYLEIKGQLYNRTDVPQTFLWWANPAVAVNDAYQSVFPQDVNAVFDHGKRAVSSFPIATGTYYKMDYSSGVDISNYKNIKVPTSYMAVNSKYNFEGGYENDTEAGMLHVASNHFSPGKKQWTWGDGDFGHAWDRNLTDSDGPYIELMAGVYTENQPDFTWLMPYEEKQFTQYFMPYRELGVVKNASKDLIINVIENELRLFATSKQYIHIIIKDDEGNIVFDEHRNVSPEQVEHIKVSLSSGRLVGAVILLKELYGKERQVLTWEPEPDEIRPIPDAAEAALLPEQIKTNDQLYLTGLHIEQYRHATYLATDYYEEALRRDPNDVRCLNAMGLWYIRKGRFELAEMYLRKAVKVIMKRNPNPYDGEPVYNLALCLKYMSMEQQDADGEALLTEAYNLFWKSTWNKAWADAGYFEAAKISVAQGRLDDALDELDRCLIYGAHNQKALALKATVLRLMGRKECALKLIEETLATDLFNYGALYEKYLLTEDASVLDYLKEMMCGGNYNTVTGDCSCKNFEELALDYAAAGCCDEALAVLAMAEELGAVTPMIYYYEGWLGKDGAYEKAEEADCSYCFPNRLEAIIALQSAKDYFFDNRSNSVQGAQAAYLLGCLYYDKRQYDLAVANWETSKELDAAFPTVHRNLALAYYNKLNDAEAAVSEMEEAFGLDETDARIFMELDQLYKRLGNPAAERLARFEEYEGLIAERDDLLLEYITLLNQTGNYEKAMLTIDQHQFHPWEGGEGKVPTQYQLARVELSKQIISRQDATAEDLQKAVTLLEQCLEYPHHLGEGKLYGAQENDFCYFLGCAYERLAELSADEAEIMKYTDHSVSNWQLATEGPQEPAAAMYYNDAKPDKIFYQGLALLKLGRVGEANGRFYKLLNYGKQHLFDDVVMDYFAVSLPDLQIWAGDLNLQNQIHCEYMLSLGNLGLSMSADDPHLKSKAVQYLEEVEQLDVNHLGIYALRTLIDLF